MSLSAITRGPSLGCDVERGLATKADSAGNSARTSSGLGLPTARRRGPGLQFLLRLWPSRLKLHSPTSSAVAAASQPVQDSDCHTAM